MLIDESARDSLHAAITVANQAHPVFTFTSFEKANGKLEKLQRTGGKTNMQEALEKSLQMFQNPNSGARAGSFRRVLVVTGGQSNVKRNKTLLNTMDLKLDAFFFYRLFFLFVCLHYSQFFFFGLCCETTNVINVLIMFFR